MKSSKSLEVEKLKPTRISLAKTYLENLKSTPKDRTELERSLRLFSKSSGESVLRKDELIAAYKTLKNPNTSLKPLLTKRGVRSESGVNIVAILTKPLSCPGNCVYCPNTKDMPKSYLPNEPAVLRATRVKFAPKAQVQNRIKALKATGHEANKIEIIIMGGTWSDHDLGYQKSYLRQVYAGLNNSKIAGTLESEIKKNETADHRCVGLTLETRPDYIDEAELIRMRSYGCTRLEIGVQCVDDEIHTFCNRGHGIKEIKRATSLMRQAGFKIVYHMMLNLPGSNPQKDIEMFKEIFTNPAYMPDQIKIYPCVLTGDCEMKKLYENGSWKPYTDEQLIDTITEIKRFVPEWTRIIRVIRDIPADDIIAGSKISNLRQSIPEGICQCIRCREIKSAEYQNPEIIERKYDVTDGQEIFISMEDKKQNKLIGLCRLFLPTSQNEKLTQAFPVLKNSAIVRELHVYGTHTSVGKSGQKSQHRGIGKALLQHTESLTKKASYKKLAVISGIGVRDYYAKRGYELRDGYMVKDI